jgi:glutathione reductase (NADPH)
MKYDYDLFVIGAGSGGRRARARIASPGGLAKVAVSRGIQDRRHLRDPRLRSRRNSSSYGAEFSQMLIDAPGYGWTMGPASFDWPTLLRTTWQKEVTRLSGIYTSQPSPRRASPPSKSAPRSWTAHTVRLKRSGKRVDRRADTHSPTGGRPYLPGGLPASSSASPRTRRSCCRIFPMRVLIVGGGTWRSSFANIFPGLGAKVRILHRSDRMLRGFDEDLRAHMHIEVERGGTQLTMKATLTKLEKAGDAISATLSTGEKVEADVVLVRLGRDPHTQVSGSSAPASRWRLRRRRRR